jgi:hypothetical protein
MLLKPFCLDLGTLGDEIPGGLSFALDLTG